MPKSEDFMEEDAEILIGGSCETSPVSYREITPLLSNLYCIRGCTPRSLPELKLSIYQVHGTVRQRLFEVPRVVD